MIRVCMVAFTHYPTDPRVRREAESLVERGDEVDVICLRKKDEVKVQILSGVRLIQLSIGRYRGQSTLMYLTQYLLFFLATSLQLTYLHLRNPYHIIQVHTMPDFMVFVTIFPKLLGAKVLLDVHDLMPELYQSKFGLNEDHWLIRFITWVERGCIRYADRAIAVHRPHLDVLIKHGNPSEKFLILLNLPDPKIFSRRAHIRSRDEGGFKLMYHGMVARRNGLSVALHALSYLKEEIRDLEFQILGDGDDIPRLMDLVRELELSDCVNFSDGYLPMEELVPVILDADVGIVPIMNDDFTRHTLPTKLLEYVALGKPVICSNTETIKTYFDDSMVQYFEPGNAVELAGYIRVLYHNPDIRKELVANAERFNRSYNWKQQKQLYYDMMDELYGSGSNTI